MTERQKIIRDLASVINRHSLENDSNTPDFILAEYMLDALQTFTKASVRREGWYGKKLEIKDPQPPHLASGLYTNEEFNKKFGKITVTNDED